MAARIDQQQQQEEELCRLRIEVARLEAALAAASSTSTLTGGRPKLVAAMSAEVRDDNPYSRLMALQRMGVVPDYERVRSLAVAVVGVGGVGRSVPVWGLDVGCDDPVRNALSGRNIGSIGWPTAHRTHRHTQCGGRDADALRGGEAATV